MPIRRKDGTIYSLQCPNPLMKEQKSWEEKYIVHNFAQEEFLVANEAKIIPLETPPQEIPKAEPKVEPKVELKPEVPESVPKILVHCLPAKTHEYFDPLYGETKKIVEYGNKFIFEAIVLGQTDLRLHLWTTNPVSKDSILYVHKSASWWRVMETEARSGGYVLDTMVSQLKPSFDN